MATPTTVNNKDGGGGGGAAKNCTACGEDVSAKPRTKDSKGRYFCTPCYQHAVAEKHARRAATPLPKVGRAHTASTDAFGLLNDEVEPLAVEDHGPNVLEQLLDLEPSREAPAMICPACRSRIAPGGYLCTVCGFNVQTNQQGATVKVKAQRTPGGAVWPPIVGITSMVFGAAGTIVYGLYFVLALFGSIRAGVLGSALVSVVPIGSLLTGLSMWLFRDGLRILRHDSDGVKWIRFWAMTKLLIYGSCLGLMMSVPPGAMEQNLDRMPGGGDVSVADIKSTILLIMLWFLSWPAFIMVFFFVPRIQNDVEAWD